MHHTMRMYSRYRERFLRGYIFLVQWTRIPLLGKMVRAVANRYGKGHCAYALTHEEALQVIEASQSLSLGPCACRHAFHNCDNPIEVEIIVGTGANFFTEDRPGDYRPISKDEAKEVMRRCHQRRLIPTMVQCRHEFYAICNCCPCCCVPLRLRNDYGIGNALQRHPDIVALFQSRSAHSHHHG